MYKLDIGLTNISSGHIVVPRNGVLIHCAQGFGSYGIVYSSGGPASCVKLKDINKTDIAFGDNKVGQYSFSILLAFCFCIRTILRNTLTKPG